MLTQPVQLSSVHAYIKWTKYTVLDKIIMKNINIAILNDLNK